MAQQHPVTAVQATNTAAAAAQAAAGAASGAAAPAGGTSTQTTESQFGTAYSAVQSQYGDPWQNDEYYNQYARLTIHNDMLRDQARTRTYMRALCEAHKDEFKDKIVLDIGCGTGILSFFAARAGARVVYAVEASDLADYTEQVVAANGLSDKILVVKGKLEEISFPVKVDIIISEWMGSFLIFESMLESVLWGRDHILKPGGNLFPGTCSILMAPVSMEDMNDEKIQFWKDVYGVDMSLLMPYAKKCAFEKPMIDVGVNGDQLLADEIVLKAFDLRTVPINVPYEKTLVPFKFEVTKDGKMQGFCAWFDTDFVPGDYKGPAVPTGRAPKSDEDSTDADKKKDSDDDDSSAAAAAATGDKKEGDDDDDDDDDDDHSEVDTWKRKKPFKSGEIVTLSTHPKQQDTHWHQVLLLFDDYTMVKKGQIVSGTIRWQRNPELLRHLIIDVTFSVNDEQHTTNERRFWLWGTE